MTGHEISVKGSHSVILLSEAKRFSLYTNSVKSSPRFKRIVEQFHTEDESKRTVRALITSLRNFEISNSGSEQLNQERLENKQRKRDHLKSYLDIILKRMRRSQPKERNLRVRPSSLWKKKDLELIPRDLVLVNHLNCGMRLRLEMETFPNVLTIPLVKPIGHGNARAVRHQETLPESKQDQKHHPPDVSTALIVQSYRRIR